MHSKDPSKSDAAFQEEFERILRDADEEQADFSHFVFPSANYAARELRARCIFLGSTFMQRANFRGATFRRDAELTGVTFTQDADFRYATFEQSADFRNATFTQANFGVATFKQDADFREAKFEQVAFFIGAKFTRAARFTQATFTEDAVFSDATFTHGADFFRAKFTQIAQFLGATFTQAAVFSKAVFTQTANFSAANFKQAVYFFKAAFTQAANFREATFTQDADFTEAKFEKEANFRWAMFKGRAEFRETLFREDGSALPGLVFGLARFGKPELVLFYQTYLGQALFHNCDVTKFTFWNVRWRRRGNGKSMVFEEDERLALDQVQTNALNPKEGSTDDRNFDLIAKLYQQLKKNYDDKRDYWTAGDFHYGEMEMKRLATPQPNRLSRWLKNMGLAGSRFEVFRRRWHRNVGLAALYKYASEYGESYNVPALWLAGFLLLFMSLYPVLGLHPALKAGGGQAGAHDSLSRNAGAPELCYRNYIHYGSLQPGGEKLSFPALLGHSLMTSVGVAALQRDLAYEPSYPWGRALSWLELALTSTLIALFLLAVRRQFRR
jgi:uncharacterized protein YjbI with pentapeptide repeats